MAHMHTGWQGLEQVLASDDRSAVGFWPTCQGDKHHAHKQSIMKRTQSQQGQLLEQPVVLFVTNCLALYRQAVLDVWTTTGCVTIDVAVTARHTDTAQDWDDIRVSCQG